MKKIIICITCLFLTACFGGRSEQADFYRLTPVEATQTYQTKPVWVLVDTVRVPETIDRPQIITMDENGIRLKINEMKRWSEPLTSMVRQTLADDMGRYLPNATVKGVAGLADTFTYTVSVEIIRFWGTTTDGKNVLEAWWSIQNAQGKIISSDKTLLTAKTGSSFDDMIQVQSRLIGELARVISQNLAKK